MRQRAPQSGPRSWSASVCTGTSWRRGRGRTASVASSAAYSILSARTARISGWRRMPVQRASRPTITPDCGPTSSLSPLKQQDDAGGDRGVDRRLTPASGCAGSKPRWRCRDPRPPATPKRRPSATSSPTGGRSLNPSMRNSTGDAQDERGAVTQRGRVSLARSCSWCRLAHTAPDCAITSGTRNPPPISISSRGETITSRPDASAARISIVAAALLLTTTAASRRSAGRAALRHAYRGRPRLTL